MNILKNLFGDKGQTEQAEALNHVTDPVSTVVEAQPEITPPVDLFVDNQPPQQKQISEQSQSKVSEFLNRNFHSSGINDGYEYHSQETLEIGMKKIKAEFQYAIDQAMENKLEKRLQARTMLVSVSKISDEARQNLELLIEELNSTINLLQKQKELSVEDEGWVMNAIHSYHQGFVQGLNDYIAGEQLLKSIKNI